jgi:hypothetical protein
MSNDLAQYYGNDMSLSATGGLLPIDGSTKTQQRIIRRLMTNPGDYIWHPTYGAGLPGMIGTVSDPAAIGARIRGQVLLEDAVAKTPPPVVTVKPIDSGVSVRIQYTDSVRRVSQIMSFSVSL